MRHHTAACCHKGQRERSHQFRDKRLRVRRRQLPGRLFRPRRGLNSIKTLHRRPLCSDCRCSTLPCCHSRVLRPYYTPVLAISCMCIMLRILRNWKILSASCSSCCVSLTSNLIFTVREKAKRRNLGADTLARPALRPPPRMFPCWRLLE